MQGYDDTPPLAPSMVLYIPISQIDRVVFVGINNGPDAAKTYGAHRLMTT